MNNSHSNDISRNICETNEISIHEGIHTYGGGGRRPPPHIYESPSVLIFQLFSQLFLPISFERELFVFMLIQILLRILRIPRIPRILRIPILCVCRLNIRVD